jgi:alkanesulfonate monooxygenase SsuD/methylene tetrahydromethanopterin reductase-like flavin-dependent oxidoreductase (luciferase family)
MLKDALQAEQLGFHSIWLDDHLLNFNQKQPENRIEAWTGLTSLANQTSNIRLGHLVLCNSFRNPALLGKMLASLDIISNGRLEFGIGAGWFKEEFLAYGLEFFSATERIEQLKETLQILKKMFTEEKFDFRGKFWNLEGCRSLPRPVQDPLPTWIGGKKPKMIKLAVEYGTGLNITSSPVEDFRKVFENVNRSCDELGKKESEFKISYMTFIHFTKDMKEREEVIDHLHETWYPQPPREAFETMMIGPTEFVKDKASNYLDNYDLNLFIANCKGTESIKDPITLYNDEIISSFK